MTTLEGVFVQFRTFADNIMAERVIAMNKLNTETEVGGKLARLRKINTEIEGLKEQLRDEKGKLLGSFITSDQHEKERLDSELQLIYEEYLNEFLFHVYNKDVS